MRYRAAILAALVMGLGGCRTGDPARAEPAPAWPPSPEAPRVVYVASICDPRDLGIAPSFWRRSMNWLTGDNRGEEPWGSPFGVWLDDGGDLCFTDTGRREVVWVDAARKHIERWNRVGNQALVSPVGVALASGLVYVADSGLGRVFITDPRGVLRGALEFPFKRPVAVGAGKGGLYVVDTVACSVEVFAFDGTWRRSIGMRGEGDGALNRPTHVALDARGWVYVTDSLNCRIQVFDEKDRWVRSIGRPGDSSGHFGRPKGVAVDERGSVFVVDGLHDRVQIFDTGGRFSLDFGGAGQAPGEFWLPAGIAVNGQGLLVVADCYNHRLQCFRVLP